LEIRDTAVSLLCESWNLYSRYVSRTFLLRLRFVTRSAPAWCPFLHLLSFFADRRVPLIPSLSLLHSLDLLTHIVSGEQRVYFVQVYKSSCFDRQGTSELFKQVVTDWF
jgi:hypothetical protein